MPNKAAYLGVTCLKQRFMDWRRERRITRYLRAMTKLTARRQYDQARCVWLAMRGEILARSAGQVERMEKGRGIGHA